MRLKLLSMGFMKGILAKIISRALFKKFDTKVNIKLREFEADTDDDKMYIHLNLDGEISKEDFEKLMDAIMH